MRTIDIKTIDKYTRVINELKELPTFIGYEASKKYKMSTGFTKSMDYLGYIQKVSYYGGYMFVSNEDSRVMAENVLENNRARVLQSRIKNNSKRTKIK